MNFNKKFLLRILAFSFLALIGCSQNRQATTPSEYASVRLSITFPESINKANQQDHNIVPSTTVDEVTISVVEVLSQTTVIREQRLTIQGQFAEGELNIPVSGGVQSFAIIVFASDVQNLRFFTGLAIEPIQAGEVRETPIVISMVPAVSVSSIGTVTSSSIFPDGPYGPNNAIDLNFGTSWFSAGSDADGETSTFTWTSPQNIFIGTTGIFNNSFHSDESFRQGFGFQQVTFQVFDGPNASGNLVYEESTNYPSTPPLSRISPFVEARSMRLQLSGHEDPSCGGFSELLIVAFDLTGEGPIRTLIAIDIEPINPVIEIGETVQFTATGRYSDGSSEDITNQVTWESSNTNLVTITTLGLATGLLQGNPTITARQGNISAQTTLTINAPQLNAIDIEPINPVIEIGETVQFTATGRYSDGSSENITNQVTWESSNTNLATITAQGLATGLLQGNPTITARQGNISAETTLTINAPQLSGATLSNLQAPLIQVNDSTSCDVFGGPIGSSYAVSFDYIDADGDVTEGSVVTIGFTFSGGGTGSFDVPSEFFTNTGDGFQGSISLGACFVFGDAANTSVTVTATVTDAGGSVSNTISTVIQRPQGGNSRPQLDAFTLGVPITPSGAVCSQR